MSSFYGFPRHYYEAKYPSKGSPELAREIISTLEEAGIKAEGVKRGLDHGVWSGFSVGKLGGLWCMLRCIFPRPDESNTAPLTVTTSF